MSACRLCVCGVVLGLVACSSDVPPSPRTLEPPQVTTVLLLDSLDRAAKLVRLPDGRMMFTEQRTGRIRVVERDGRLLDEPFFDAAINGLRERGGLGLAPDPAFTERPYVYYFFVPSRSGLDSQEEDDVDSIRVMRLEASGNVAGDTATLLRLPSQPGPYHNAGNVLFGPDGMLYVSLGELNRNASLNSQRHGGGNWKGKILRFRPDGSVPDDNPLGPGNAIYIYGVRNPYDFTFHGSDARRVYITDNGPAGHDEVNLAQPGENLGWPLIWGFADHWYERIPRAFIGDNFRAPAWESFQERVAPTGIEVLRTDLYGDERRGRVLFGSVNTGRIQQVEIDPELRLATGFGLFAEGMPLITDLVQDADGRIYVLTLNSLYRIDPTPAP